MAKVKYNGTVKARLSWNSMGKGYSYNVLPGQILVITDDQAHNCCAAGPCTILTGPKFTKTKINKKVLPKEAPLKIVKLTPIIEEIEINPIIEEVEDVEIPVIEDDIEIFEGDVTDVEISQEPIVIDYTSFKKAELKNMCRDRDLRTNGNRDDLITRLCNHDNGINNQY